MAEVKISRGLQANYDAIVEKDADTVYVCRDTGRCYLGERLLSSQPSLSLTGGRLVYYNGVDVTSSPSLRDILVNARTHWYGSQSSYNTLIDTERVEAGVAYHIEVQPDWNETDPNNLGYIKNQPNIMDLEYVGDDHALRFFYKRHNQEITT